MRIGFDCAKLAKGTGKSIGIYNVAKSVITNMVGKLPEGYEMVVFGNEINRCDFDIRGVEFIAVDINIEDKKDVIMWELFRVNRYIKKYKIDKIMFLRGFTSLHCPVPDVILIHDLIPFFYHKHYPRALGFASNAYIMFRLKQSIRKAKQIITISEYSKQEIVKLVPSAMQKTTVIHHGYDRRRRNYAVVPAKDDYIIGIASMLPHKNAKGIVKAYEQYFAGVEYPARLVLTGVTSLQEAGISVDGAVASRIECKPYMEDREYYTLFKNAKVMLFLTLIEGFGLPPLEAMELGVPVICSNKTSLPEVVNDAGILVDPNNTNEIARQLERVMQDDKLREEMIFNGYVNLGSFLWEDKIQQYIKVLVSE